MSEHDISPKKDNLLQNNNSAGNKEAGNTSELENDLSKHIPKEYNTGSSQIA